MTTKRTAYHSSLYREVNNLLAAATLVAFVDDTKPADIAAAIAEETDRVVTYRDVETDGATSAAKRIANLL